MTKLFELFLVAPQPRRICVVDPRAADYTPRIREVFGDDGGFGLVEVLSTDEFVAGLADSFMQGHVLQLVQQWTDERDVPVLASLANAKHAPVTAVLRKETEIEVVGSTWFTSLNEATGLTAPRGLVAQEILEAVKAGTKTFVRNEAGDRRLIYDVTPLRREIGRSPVWMQLRCQG